FRGGGARVDGGDGPVDGVGGGEDAAAVAYPSRVGGDPEPTARGGARADAAAKAEPGDHVVPGSEPEQRAVRPVPDPDTSARFSQRRGLAAEGDGRRSH